MPSTQDSISLGFATERFPAGVHICQVYSDDPEREDALLRFLQSGLEAGERACCLTDRETPASLTEKLARRGLSYAEHTAAGNLQLARTRDVYFEDNRFDPDRMLRLLTRYYEDAMAAGCPAARVIGEMTPSVQCVPRGEPPSGVRVASQPPVAHPPGNVRLPIRRAPVRWSNHYGHPQGPSVDGGPRRNRAEPVLRSP